MPIIPQDAPAFTPPRERPTREQSTAELFDAYDRTRAALHAQYHRLEAAWAAQFMPATRRIQ